MIANKIDLLSEAEAAERIEAIKAALDWQGPVYQIAGISSTNTDMLCKAIMSYIESLPKITPEELEAQAKIGAEFKWEQYHQQQMGQAAEENWDDEDDDDDDWDDEDGAEVIYQR